MFTTLIIDLKSQLFVDNDLSVTNRKGLLVEDIKRLLFHDLGFLRLLEVLNKLILGMVSSRATQSIGSTSKKVSAVCLHKNQLMTMASKKAMIVVVKSKLVIDEEEAVR